MIEDIRTSIQSWDQAAWCLAAVAAGYGDPIERLSGPAREVLAALALPTTAREIETSTDLSAPLLAGQAAAPLLQIGSALRDGDSTWAGMPDEALVAQGRGSAQMVAAFKSAVLPSVPTLAEALEGEAPRMLDVGTGVGLMALEFAHAFPRLRVIGIDVMPRVLELARRLRDEHPAGRQVELVEQDVAALDWNGEFDLAWLPAPFIPPDVMGPAVEACARSLRSGGWLMMAYGKFGSDPLEDALNRFKTACFGGTAMNDDHAEQLVRSAGLEDLVRVPTPPGAPAILLGRAHRSSERRSVDRP